MRDPYRKLRTRVFSILRKKQGSVTYGTDRANEVNFKKLLSTYEPKPELKVASEDQIIEALLSLDNRKIGYDAIKVLELVRNVKIVYFDAESMKFINVLLESAKQKAILNS